MLTTTRSGLAAGKGPALLTIALALQAQWSSAQDATGEAATGASAPVVCERIRGGRICARANAEGKLPPQLLHTLRVEVVTLLEDATNCIDNKPNLNCGRRYLDEAMGRTDLNSYEAALVLNLDAYYWIRSGRAEQAVWSYERMMELPQDEIPASLSLHARRLLDALYLLADRPVADRPADGAGRAAE
jgi:hypothetical protein